MILQKKIESKLAARIIEISVSIIVVIVVIMGVNLILKIFGYSVDQLIEDISVALFWQA